MGSCGGRQENEAQDARLGYAARAPACNLQRLLPSHRVGALSKEPAAQETAGERPPASAFCLLSLFILLLGGGLSSSLRDRSPTK